MQLVNATANGDIEILTNMQFLLRAIDHQISQAVENLGRLFVVSDIYKIVEIRDMQRALKILYFIINDAFVDATTTFRHVIFCQKTM